MKLILIFMSIIKKIQVDNKDQEYILFRIDIYFTEYFLAVEIDEKGHTDRDLVFEEKRQKALEQKLNCEFIRINTSRKIMMQTMKLVEYRRLLVSLRTKKKSRFIKEQDAKGLLSDLGISTPFSKTPLLNSLF